MGNQASHMEGIYINEDWTEVGSTEKSVLYRSLLYSTQVEVFQASTGPALNVNLLHERLVSQTGSAVRLLGFRTCKKSLWQQFPTIEVTIQRIILCLGQVKCLKDATALGLLRQVLTGYQILAGSGRAAFGVSAEMIGINLKRQIKIWHNADRSCCLPQYPMGRLTFQKEVAMVRNIIQIIAARTQFQDQLMGCLEGLLLVPKLGFREALAKVAEFEAGEKEDSRSTSTGQAAQQPSLIILERDLLQELGF